MRRTHMINIGHSPTKMSEKMAFLLIFFKSHNDNEATLFEVVIFPPIIQFTKKLLHFCPVATKQKCNSFDFTKFISWFFLNNSRSIYVLCDVFQKIFIFSKNFRIKHMKLYLHVQWKELTRVLRLLFLKLTPSQNVCAISINAL